jgi:hypothetical protein
MQGRRLDAKAPIIRGAEREPAETPLSLTEPVVIQQHHVAVVTVYERARGLWHVLHQEPYWLSLDDTPLEFGDQVPVTRLVAVGSYDVDETAERLARRPTNHPIEHPRWRVKCLDVTAPEEIRTADHAKTFKLEGAVEETDAGK